MYPDLSIRYSDIPQSVAEEVRTFVGDLMGKNIGLDQQLRSLDLDPLTLGIECYQ